MKFLASDGNANDSFGWSVDTDGVSVLVGAISDDVGTVINQGTAYLFNLNCAFSISPTSQNVAASGGTGVITVTTGAGCSWTATSEPSWISLAENGGSGSGIVNFLVTTNTGAPRTGNVYVAGQIFTVTQDSGCDYIVTPGAQVFSETGGSGTISISTGIGCQWTAVSNDGWITINGSGTGTRTGSFSYTVAAFGGGTRTGTMTVTNKTVTIVQTSGCAYAISPTSQTIPGFGGSIHVGVFTRPTCAWTAQSNDNWISVSFGANGVGDGSVSLSVNQTSSSSPRTGTVTIAGQTFTVFQQGNCSFTVTPLNQVFGSEGANGTINVSTQSGCQWTAQSNAAWVTITSGLTGSGSGSVGFTVAPNQGGSRTGLLNIAGQTVFINQTGRLVFYPLPYPVRLLDTRLGETACNAPGTPIQGGTARTQFALAPCNGINFPSNASAITGNITTVNSGGGYLTVYPSDVAQPLVANSNFSPNQILNNVFTVGLSNVDHAFNIFVVTTTDVVVDVTGYYAPLGAGGLYFHPLPKPIRLLETRAGETGCQTTNSQLQANSVRTQLGITTCDGVTIPAGA
ncbi:MAG: BACON domain-containing carbohydrate-binding protein, partial [Acidobacteriota bacterium]